MEYPHLKAMTNAKKPNKPNTMEGIPANVSVVSLITFTSFDPRFAYSTRYMAAAIPTGSGYYQC